MQTWDGRRGVQELRDFLAQCHLDDQNLNAFLHRQGWVKETKIHRSSIQSSVGAIERFHRIFSGDIRRKHQSAMNVDLWNLHQDPIVGLFRWKRQAQRFPTD